MEVYSPIEVIKGNLKLFAKWKIKNKGGVENLKR